MIEYSQYVKPIMDELGQIFKYLTQVDDNCWLIQSNPNSMMESYTIHTTNNGHIIMSGDYDGVMVRPYGAEHCLINWMAGATTLSYFAEKVIAANRHHQCKIYSEKMANNNIRDIKEYVIEDLEGEELKEKEKEFNDLVDCKSLEYEGEYWSLIQEIENEFKIYDLCEYDPTDYTNRIQWQHKCLLFWANKVLDGAFKKEKQSG